MTKQVLKCLIIKKYKKKRRFSNSFHRCQVEALVVAFSQNVTYANYRYMTQTKYHGQIATQFERNTSSEDNDRFEILTKKED